MGKIKVFLKIGNKLFLRIEKQKMYSMKEALKDPRDNPLIPISDTEISQKLPGIKIVSYPELANGLPCELPCVLPCLLPCVLLCVLPCVLLCVLPCVLP